MTNLLDLMKLEYNLIMITNDDLRQRSATNYFFFYHLHEFKREKIGRVLLSSSLDIIKIMFPWILCLYDQWLLTRPALIVRLQLPSLIELNLLCRCH